MIKKVTIVVPVYADWPSLKDCIDSLKKFVDKRHKIILVNDCGPEADSLEGNIQEAIKDQGNFYYYRNPENLGFVKTCNRAVLELDKTGNDVLLLNSDTKVTEGFLEEMLTVLYGRKNIGVVSPRTNNATICTIPISSISRKGIEAKKSYEIFIKNNRKFPRYNEIPTAHGFCMLIRRSLIKKYGLFDEVFGMGYGEEVDFCQKMAQHGWLSVLSNWSYVFHLEAKSFSLEKKAKLIEEASIIIRQRYPGYKKAVTEYIQYASIQESTIFGSPTEKIKNLIRRNPKIHGLAKTVKRSNWANKYRRN